MVQPGTNLARWFWRVADIRVIDGMVMGITRLISGSANLLRFWQSGNVRNYALSMFVGVVLVVCGALLGMIGGR